MKTCSKCKETKELAEFSKDLSVRDGLMFRCKICANTATAAWRTANYDKQKAGNMASGAAYRAANPEKVKAATAAWVAANQDRVKAVKAAYYIANKDMVTSAVAIWSAANREKTRETHVAWHTLNPKKAKIYKHNRRARKCAAGGKLSHGLAEKLFILQKGKCPCCKQPLGDNYHLDHIMPLALGGPNTDWNIQLLRQRCNNQKSAKDPIDFMQSRGFLL